MDLFVRKRDLFHSFDDMRMKRSRGCSHLLPTSIIRKGVGKNKLCDCMLIIRKGDGDRQLSCVVFSSSFTFQYVHLVIQGVGKNKLCDRMLQLLRREREYIQLHRFSFLEAQMNLM